MISYGIYHSCKHDDWAVLILIVMEDSLVPSEENYLGAMSQCLNPCCSGRWSRTLSEQISLQYINPYCSGQWSRTRPYKTILIISKLKNFTKQILTFLNRKLTVT